MRLGQGVTVSRKFSIESFGEPFSGYPSHFIKRQLCDWPLGKLSDAQLASERSKLATAIAAYPRPRETTIALQIKQIGQNLGILLELWLANLNEMPF